MEHAGERRERGCGEAKRLCAGAVSDQQAAEPGAECLPEQGPSASAMRRQNSGARQCPSRLLLFWRQGRSMAMGWVGS
jgi:hypothetical protein